MTGVIVFIYLAAFHITETEYFAGEEGVVIPIHVVEEHPGKMDDPIVELQEDSPKKEAKTVQEITGRDVAV